MKVYIAQVRNTKLMKNSNDLSSLLQQLITFSSMIQGSICFKCCISFFFLFFEDVAKEERQIEKDLSKIREKN